MKKALKIKGFKNGLVGLGAISLVISLSACGPVDAVKSTLQEDSFPPLPNPEVATYLVDLSGSTFPTAQLEALGSGVAEFLSGEALGLPFAETPVAPRGLSVQFVTKNSAQAPRILLVSTKTSRDLYDFVKSNASNKEVANRLWNGFITARSNI